MDHNNIDNNMEQPLVFEYKQDFEQKLVFEYKQDFERRLVFVCLDVG